MKSDNNGKIAVAIVAMFVVALSIVGITYAYFTVSVVNNKTTKSVEVTAGVLEINYTNGNEIVANNIVPGWESDGLHYFDSVASYFTPALNDVNGNGEYDSDVDGETPLLSEGKEVKAVKAVKAANSEEVTTKKLTDADGITEPVTFSVTNTDRNSGDNNYAIKLVSISNDIATNNSDDAKNLTYELYRTTTETTEGGTLIGSGALGTSEQYIVYDVERLAKGNNTNYYYLKLKYADDGNQDLSKKATVKATVKVVGVVNTSEEENSAVWVDSDNGPVTFATK